MPSYKLIYFDVRGRAELARLLFAVSDTPFEDDRLSREEWGEVKPTTPFGQLPALEVDGQVFGQSVAIATYLAREFGLFGKSNLDGLKIDQVIQQVGDFTRAHPGPKLFFEKDEAKKAELMKAFVDGDLPKYLSSFEKLLKESGTGFFVGSSLTLADLAVFEALDRLVRVPIEEYPLLQALVAKVSSNDKIEKYLSTRKSSPF